MNVYDFDGTIYDGDSSIDFYLFCIKKKPSVFIKCIFTQISGFLLYYLKKIPKEEYKEKFFSFVKYISVDDQLLSEFWAKKIADIKQWYLTQKDSSDVIISASPQFLLQPVCDELSVTLIATRVDSATGKFSGNNCYGEEKVKRFFENYPDGIIEKFYTDSLSDIPLMRISDEAFLVKKQRIIKYKVGEQI